MVINEKYLEGLKVVRGDLSKPVEACLLRVFVQVTVGKGRKVPVLLLYSVCNRKQETGNPLPHRDKLNPSLRKKERKIEKKKSDALL